MQILGHQLDVEREAVTGAIVPVSKSHKVLLASSALANHLNNLSRQTQTTNNQHMIVKIQDNKLVIEIPLQTPTASASGKNLIVASTNGIATTTALVNGKPVKIGLNALAELVRDSILTLVLEEGLSWDTEFEVKQPTPILVTDANFDQVFPSGWSTPKDERNPE